jgi:hypothetical protein
LVCASDAHPHPRGYFVHDLWGNVIAELTTAGATVREYIWLPETEIAPTRPAPSIPIRNTPSPSVNVWMRRCTAKSCVLN